jgi:type II secretory pathway pseudopilin PulG
MAAAMQGAGPSRSAGFSLIELAMVLFIISLVVGGLLVPLSTQLEARQRNDTQARLEEIREALIGYALINGRLPCPTNELDPNDADYGYADANCNTAPAIGYLPWKELGVVQYDSWGVARTSASDPMYGYWRYIVDTEFACPGATPACDGSTQVALSDGPSDGLAIEDDYGNSLSSSSEPPVAIVYSAGARDLGNEDGDNDEETGKEDGENATTETSPGPYIYAGGTVTQDFDDLTIWLTRPLLFSRMVAAGTLP